MQKPLITIGITAYNARNTIQAALDSAIAQKWDHTEIIVVDDCSTDGTYDFLKAQSQIKLYQTQQNAGVAAARNMIIEYAKGEYIAFFDDDDISDPNRIEKQYGALQKIANKDFALCYTARTQKFKDGACRIEPCVDNHRGECVAQRILFGKPLSGHDIGSVATCSLMAKTSVFKMLGGFDEVFRRSEDTDFAIRAALKNAYFVGVDEPLVIQMMTHADEKKLDEEYKFVNFLLDKHRDFLRKQGHAKHAKAWLSMKYQYYRGEKVSFFLALLKLMITYPILTTSRIIWSLPNIGFNMAYKKFQNAHEE